MTTSKAWSYSACGDGRNTIMSSAGDFPGNPEDRVLRYSNPGLSQCGSPTGTSNNNAAGFFNANGQTIANYIPNVGDFSFVAWISGPWSVCAGQAETFYANTKCSDGGVSYQWHRSVNGGPYQLMSYASNYDNWFPNGTANGTNYVVRLTAINGAGNTVVSTKNGSVNSSCGGGWRPSFGEVNSDQNGIVVFPNPANGADLNVQFQREFSEGSVLRILDAKLQPVYTETMKWAGGQSTHKLPLNRPLTSGLYFVSITDVKKQSTDVVKIIVQ